MKATANDVSPRDTNCHLETNLSGRINLSLADWVFFALNSQFNAAL